MTTPEGPVALDTNVVLHLARGKELGRWIDATSRLKIHPLRTSKDEEQRTARAQLAGARRLRQAALTSAFDGRLAPHDPNDEPASVLLERIRARDAATASVSARAPRRRSPRIAAEPAEKQ